MMLLYLLCSSNAEIFGCWKRMLVSQSRVYPRYLSQSTRAEPVMQVCPY